MVLGIYYLTIDKPNSEDSKLFKGAGSVFSSEDEAITAYHTKNVDLFAKVKLRTTQTESGLSEIIETTVGRIIFNKTIVDSIEKDAVAI
jgi:DNA-directed RNA polymerase subunit beta'